MATSTGDGKASFDHLYNQPDPRALFRALDALSYQVPHHAHPVFAALLRAGTVLDICCSYGVNAALLRCELSLADLYDHYADPALAELSADELAARDHRFYAEHRRPDAPSVLGLDTADRALGYGRAVGLLDAGWTENLESDEPSDDLSHGLSDVGLVTISGGVGYITERTFERVFGAFPSGSAPWVAAFVLRMYSYDRIAATLARHGLVTEQLSDTTFKQRRFASSDEQSATIRAVRARGFDTSGKEDDGWLHCDFFLSRPADDTGRQRLSDVLAS